VTLRILQILRHNKFRKANPLETYYWAAVMALQTELVNRFEQGPGGKTFTVFLNRVDELVGAKPRISTWNVQQRTGSGK
jgi:hypothetical protein